MFNQHIVLAIIPARDEQDSIGKVVADLFDLKDEQGHCIIDYVVVCDNGSTDDTTLVAREAGAITVFESKEGYGAACLAALAVMPNSDFIIFIDGDHSFYAKQCLPMLQTIDDGADLVIGSRALGFVERGALTLPQRFGNKLATWLINLLWKKSITDLGPFRVVTSAALESINMQDVAFGWTVEMQVKAIQQNMIIKEVAVNTRPRIGQSKISGTLKGIVGAAIGIFGTIFRLWYGERFKQKKSKHNSTQS